MATKGFSFSLPSLPRDNQLQHLSFDDWFEMGGEHFGLPSFPPKTLSQIVQLVLSGRSDDIHIFEWLDALENQAQWDALGYEELEQACVAVWSGIAGNSTLGDIACFKIGLALDGKPSTMVSPILDSIAIAASSIELDDFVKLKINWLVSLQQADYFALTESCYKLNKTISEAIRWLRLPQANAYSALLQQYLCSVMPKRNIDASDDLWLATSFLGLVTTQQRLNFFEQFVERFQTLEFGELTEELVEKHCLPTQTDSYWSKLSSVTQGVLKRRYNLSSYYDLYSISSALYSQEAGDELGFAEEERRQIRSRSMFWSNYSSRFNRVRVLLPSDTYRFVQQRNGGVQPFVTTFNKVGHAECEVYIFELDNTIAVEFLRGSLSETRFFTRNDWNSQRLFDAPELSASDIRAMSQQEVHDHLPCWQYFCEKLLRLKFRLTPNIKIRHFRGLPPEVNTYVEGQGLPEPSASMLAERRRGLEAWVEKFWSAEMQTGKFGTHQGRDDKSQLFLAKALMAKQMGDILEYEQLIKKAAEQGSSEAMWQLGKTMLLNPRSSAQTKLQGEAWIAKAAGVGHIDANAICQRYGFTPIQPANNGPADKLEQCLTLLQSVREFDQQKGLEILGSADRSWVSQELKDALILLLSHSKNALIRREISNQACKIDCDDLLFKIAEKLVKGNVTEQLVAIRMYSKLYERGYSTAVEHIQRLADSSNSLGQITIMKACLESLSDFGVQNATKRLEEVNKEWPHI